MISFQMISFARREDVVPSALILLSLLMLSGTLAYMLLVPKPSVAGGASAQSRRRMVDDLADTRLQERRAGAAIRPRLWHSDDESVTSTVLAQISRLAARRSVKLTAFRPERGQAFPAVTELRFAAQMTGSYKDIHAVMAALDARGSKVVLRAVQIASAQEADHAVTATLGLSAFVAADPDLMPQPAHSARKGGGRG